MLYRIKNQNGFTIVELLIVIVIIGILSALVIVSYNGVQKRANIAVIQSELDGAAKKLEVYKIGPGNSDSYPSDQATAGVTGRPETTYTYTYNAADNSYCLTASNNGIDYKITSADTSPKPGACPTGPTVPSGYEVATLIPGGSTDFNGYSAIQPLTCPSSGGNWIKVPGNSLYNKPNGFCVQQYPAVNVGGVPTSQPAGNRWTALTQPAAASAAATVDTGTHLFSEDEWMTIATNAAAQPTNWSGGSIGSGTLSIGSSSSVKAGVSMTLSNGSVIYFDTGSGSYYASNEWTCYTGPSANNCGLAAQSQPIPANAYYTDQFGYFTSYGAFPTDGSGRYYGDPRYGNSALAPFVTSARNKGLGYLRTSYAAGSGTVFAFSRGSWTGVASSGLFTLYMFTQQNYAQATYGFRVAL